MSEIDEDVMAYVDGELDFTRRAEFERAIAVDPELEQRVAAESELRDRFRRAFDPVLSEVVPARLVASLAPSPIATSHRLPQRGRNWQALWTSGFGIAAGLLLGLMLSPRILPPQDRSPALVNVGSVVEARGDLAAALTQRLASELTSPGGVRLGVTYLAKTGVYCRTFVLDRRENTLSGLACRNHDAWQVQALQSTTGESSRDTYRQAASALPPLIGAAVDASIAGEALDATGEARARDHRWQAPMRKPDTVR